MNSTTNYGNSREGFGKDIDEAAEKIYNYIRDINSSDAVACILDHPEGVGLRDSFTFPKANNDDSRLEIPLSKYGLPVDWKELIGAFLYRTKAHTLFISFGYLSVRLYVIQHSDDHDGWDNHYSFLDCRPAEAKEEAIPDANVAELKKEVRELQQIVLNLSKTSLKIIDNVEQINSFFQGHVAHE